MFNTSQSERSNHWHFLLSLIFYFISFLKSKLPHQPRTERKRYYFLALLLGITVQVIPTSANSAEYEYVTAQMRYAVTEGCCYVFYDTLQPAIKHKDVLICKRVDLQRNLTHFTV